VLLHELLAACAVTGLVVAGTYTMLEHGLRAQAAGVARAESQQAARAALTRLSAELRNAGRGVRWTAPAIVVAEPSRVVLASDLDDDGSTAARGELIAWHLAGSVLRRTAGAGAQPVVNGVEAFELRYFDGAGRETAIPAAIRTIEVSLTTTAAGPGSTLIRGTAVSMATRVRLRNR
jgi:hypothetical protein